MQNKKAAAHMLQAAAIQCRNLAATQCRKTSAKEKNSSNPLHATAGPTLRIKNFFVQPQGSSIHARKQQPRSGWLWDGLDSSQNKTYCMLPNPP